MPHIHDKIDFTVEVFIVCNNKVLLRKHDKYKLWMSIGGHIELYEDPNQAAIREVKEEVGLDIELYDKSGLTNKINISNSKELIPPILLNRHFINENHEHITLVYFAKSNTNKLILPIENEKSEECRWFSEEELDNNDFGINDRIKEYAKTALETINSNN